MTTLAQPTITRHGTAHLWLRINTTTYSLLPRGTRTAPAWEFVACDGPRAGTRYSVRSRPQLTCTCPDKVERGATCKHLGALLATRLITAPRTRTEATS